MERGLLNPKCFKKEFKKHGWFPFEDFTFSELEVEAFLKSVQVDGKVYRSDMPCRDLQPSIYSIERPSQVDVMKISSWLAYHEGLMWTISGNIIINSFFDYVVLALSREAAEAMFGDDLETIYNNSVSVFVENCQNDDTLIEFMEGVQETWTD
jgi:hypothetical protein